MSPAGYSGTPLPKKLGFKSGHRVYFANPPAEFEAHLGPLPDDTHLLTRPTKPLDLAILFAANLAELNKHFAKLAKLLAPDGMLWIAWPKKAAKIPTDLTENVIRDIGLGLGLVDVKVCAVSEIWSGLKFVIPVKDRK